AALPEHLVESELFGYEKGAFSGATRTTRGKFEATDGGVLLLDEIGEMPLAVQAKLLRVLQENEVSRLGAGSKTVPIDVRVIAASNRPLEDEIEHNRFREDLYYRICTHTIYVPPLRERIEDVEPLTLHFVERTCERFDIRPKKVHPDTIAQLKAYHWSKNNVRELINIIERMIIQATGPQLLPKHIPADIREPGPVTGRQNGKSYQELKYEAERHILLRALEANDWHITNTAKALDISNHSNLLKMMRRLDIQRPDDA
ncbi:MAG: sigma 54-interacting transcriptional regulator, partial [Calditrichota bacterium]